MNGWELLKSIGVFAAGSTILITALGFIARSAFLHFLSHDLETHKAKLTADNALVLERFKAELHATAFKYERLHEERLRIFAELYRLLADADKAYRDFLRPIQVGGRQEHRQAMLDGLKKAQDFLSYFEGKRIYFDINLCALIDALEVAFRRALVMLGPLLASDNDKPIGKAWPDAWKEFMDTVPPLRREIETRARELLGVSDSAAAQATNP